MDGIFHRKPSAFERSATRGVNGGMMRVLIFALFMNFPAFGSTDSATNAPPSGIEEKSRNRLVLGTTAVGVGAVTVWGIAQWDYFSKVPSAGEEGWFGKDTDEGGMDKLGHLYTSYVMAHGISCWYETRDFSRDEAAFYGSLTSFAVMGGMELGDSFSDYGFSCEDMVMNASGCLLGWLLYSRPDLASKIDLRWEYGLKPTKGDVVTDYENSKFLLALKLNGFKSMQKNPWRHIELHLGYHTEGFDDKHKDNERVPYVGVGVNFTDWFRRRGCEKTATVFNYMQLPYTAANYEF
ncbi:DUF2279 domain-containing protein [Pontiella sulfatireligans]|uniref:DUF2279 domain-containing protein n=1 Tax=Pontiella sulfatireligans TaxID=2750658 RepID=A0A6C2UUA7_9BACT|nr:DUF2279 domain-containing protein [Pontiella sulfatireligans]VGO22754.1 hypothetical protein SCARR_04850 [Pontiella sulfatireligans]